MSKESQVPLGGMIGNDHFGELVDIKEPMEEQNDTMEAQNDIEEDDDVSIEHHEFGYIIFFISLNMDLKTMLNFANFL